LRIEHYQSNKGRIPFDEWFDSLDGRHRAAVERRIAAVEEHDHFGDCSSLRGGLHEMRLLGLGLRIYFTYVGETIILLLGGSDKGSQKRAIKTARIRLKDFKERTK
jgi:putative addiction module killer protein